MRKLRKSVKPPVQPRQDAAIVSYAKRLSRLNDELQDANKTVASAEAAYTRALDHKDALVAKHKEVQTSLRLALHTKAE